MRVIIAGPRDWKDRSSVHTILDGMLWQEADSRMNSTHFTVVHGDCPTGVDHFTSKWAKAQHYCYEWVHEEPHPADWDRYGKAAGPKRNAEMAASDVDHCVVFKRAAWSRGAYSMYNQAKKYAIPTWVIEV